MKKILVCLNCLKKTNNIYDFPLVRIVLEDTEIKHHILLWNTSQVIHFKEHFTALKLYWKNKVNMT